MKPSGPGLLFVGSFLITVSISILVIDWSVHIFSFFLVQSWEIVPLQEFVHFFQVVYFISTQLLIVASYDSLHFCGVSCNFPFFNSNFIDLSPFLFFLDESG